VCNAYARYTDQPREAAIQHYSRGYPGGKPTYNLKLTAEQKGFYTIKNWPQAYPSIGENCQGCYNLKECVPICHKLMTSVRVYVCVRACARARACVCVCVCVCAALPTCQCGLNAAGRVHPCIRIVWAIVNTQMRERMAH
jgi:hypothetical protein